MKFAVCIKQVPATDARIRIASSRNAIDVTDVTMVLNPFDEHAIEEVLKAKERHGGEVAVVTVGPAKAMDALRTCLAMGADRAVHVELPDPLGPDSFATATLLAKALAPESYDLIVFGKQAVDDDNAAVGIQVAELLSLPHVSLVGKFELSEDGKTFIAHRAVEAGVEVYEGPLPVVITADRSLNQPRYPSLPGIMKAKHKPVQKIDGASWLPQPTITVESLSLPPSRQGGTIVEGNDPKVATDALLRYLRDELKVV